MRVQNGRRLQSYLLNLNTNVQSLSLDTYRHFLYNYSEIMMGFPYTGEERFFFLNGR